MAYRLLTHLRHASPPHSPAWMQHRADIIRVLLDASPHTPPLPPAHRRLRRDVPGYDLHCVLSDTTARHPSRADHTPIMMRPTGRRPHVTVYMPHEAWARRGRRGEDGYKKVGAAITAAPTQGEYKKLSCYCFDSLYFCRTSTMCPCCLGFGSPLRTP